jgi:hypothetical protein
MNARRLKLIDALMHLNGNVRFLRCLTINGRRITLTQAEADKCLTILKIETDER